MRPTACGPDPKGAARVLHRVCLFYDFDFCLWGAEVDFTVCSITERFLLRLTTSTESRGNCSVHNDQVGSVFVSFHDYFRQMQTTQKWLVPIQIISGAWSLGQNKQIRKPRNCAEPSKNNGPPKNRNPNEGGRGRLRRIHGSLVLAPKQCGRPMLRLRSSYFSGI